MPVYEIASQTCSTCSACEELHRLRKRNEAAYRTAHKHYLAALRTGQTAALVDLEEELKQTSAARKIIGYTIQVHESRQHCHPVAA